MRFYHFLAVLGMKVGNIGMKDETVLGPKRDVKRTGCDETHRRGSGIVCQKSITATGYCIETI